MSIKLTTKEAPPNAASSSGASPLIAIVPSLVAARKKPAAPAPKQSWWLTLAILAVVGGGIYYAYPHILPYLSLNRTVVAPPAARVIPVVTHSVDQTDMDLYLNGLGTVTSFKTVTIRSRVDGELVKIAFTEGQMVQQGDLLAEIDPRPYRVQLQEAEAQLQRDKAALKLALLDYERYESLVAFKDSHQAAARHAKSAGATKPGHDSGRSRRDRQRQAATDLLPHHGARQRPDRSAERRPGQHGARQRPERAGRHHATAADRRGLHDSAGRHRPRAKQDAGRRETGRRGLRSRVQDQAGHRHAGRDRQPGRFDDRHGAAEGGLSRTKTTCCFPISSSMRGCWSKRGSTRWSCRRRPCSAVPTRRSSMSCSPTRPSSCAKCQPGRPKATRRSSNSGLAAGETVVIDGVDKLQNGDEGRSARFARQSAEPNRGRHAAEGGTEGKLDESVPAIHSAAGRDGAADGRHPAGRASSPIDSCRSRRCRRSIIRRFRCSRSIPAPAPT